MVGKISGMKALIDKIRIIPVTIWTILGGATYASGCIVVSLVSRHAARALAQLWHRHLLFFGGVEVRITGMEKLKRGERYVFISNHQSALDIPVLTAGIKHQLSFIAKKELFMIPFFGWGMAAIGHIWIDRQNARKARVSISRAVKSLEKENISLVLFPEGTRSADGKIKDFKQGSFTLAIESKAKLIPVAIKNTHQLLPKKKLRIRPGIAFVELGDPIETADLKISDKAELAKKVKEIISTMLSK